MENDITINEDLYFCNEIDFSDKLDNDQLNKMKQIRKTIIRELKM